MASGRDVRDLLGLPGDTTPKPAVQKQRAPKSTALAKRIRMSRNSTVEYNIVLLMRGTIEGVAREVAALYGERPPPVAVYEEKKSYRAKRTMGVAKKWWEHTATLYNRCV
jgi:DNA methyltransferase 1-associated protein 1